MEQSSDNLIGNDQCFDHFRGSIKFFQTLGSTFWTTDQILTKSYQFKINLVNTSLKNCVSDEESKSFKKQKENLEKSYEVLHNQSVSEYLLL